MKKLFFLLAMLTSVGTAFSQKLDLQKMLAGHKLAGVPASDAQPMQDGDKKGITIKNNVWLTGVDFSYGTIEVDIKGRNEFLHSFPGIAFHAADTSKNYDVVYFRPFNFQHADTARRKWSVQYVSLPYYPYDRLRKENTGQFESEIFPNPKPGGWLHARIVVSRDSIKVYVNGMNKPSLVTKNLQMRPNGQVGLWADLTTADFANLSINKDN
ncbi:hypothetical protein [Mucilaginibacter ginsenosidivorans]|uniref:DUF1080 domain-containing protein n=1 Tax=Mucilaginibacter ginsenosidivorans TaxID=398053 RepID=A0A5B8UXT5_9SPHI|nr:hypothetical protein [Mucilaginibacter ginsenosidivorans]QEC63495.1 hypothetical protein FRZ54_13205 [Mucilaginibacter ginsenosidivorans]